MIGSAEDLEISKENIQPLKQGRIVSQLSMALKAQTDATAQHELLEQQRYHEIQIRLYEGDDPLEPWYNYAMWVEQSFVKDGGTCRLQQLLQKCLTRFKDDPRYKQDLRFVRLWITYIELQVHPQELYRTVFSHGIGTKCALFYRSWAYEFERLKDFKNADKVYRLAYENYAEPKEELDAAHERMTYAVGQAVLGYEVQTPEKPINEQRQVFANLQGGKKGKVVSRVGSAVQNQMPGRFKSSQLENNVQGFSIKIFNEEEEATADSYLSSELQRVPRREVLLKENVSKPGPWTNAHRKTRTGVPMASAAPVTRVASLQFPIHEDETNEQYSTNPSQDLMPSLRVRKELVCDIKCPIAVFEEPDPTRRPMYCKNKVYAGNVEFSFEELRANVYRKRYAQQQLEGLKKVEGMSSEENPVNQLCEASKQNALVQRSASVSATRNVSSDTQLRLQNSSETNEFVVPGQFSQSKSTNDGVNRDQSSLHSQSITVNTREALMAVGELWTTPQDVWLPPSKTLGNACQSLFPSNKEVTSESKSLPFQIYTDDQSICQPHQPIPQLVEQKPVKSILKPVPKIFVQSPPNQLETNRVIAEPDKENAKFSVFCDEDDGQLSGPNELKTAKFGIPFVPSPGMSEEELSRLKDSDSKENIAPPGMSSVERVHRNVATGVLQLSKTVPFLTLEEQERLENEYEDLGVQRLSDNSEVGNETCNTQAFSFPLQSSTPFTNHFRDKCTADGQAAPEENTMNLMNGNQMEDQPKIVHNNVNTCSEAKTPAGATEDLSVIMESSREYKSSSSSGSSCMVTRRTTYSVKGSLGKIEELSSRFEDNDKNEVVRYSEQLSNFQTKNIVYNKVEKKTEEVTFQEAVISRQIEEVGPSTQQQIQVCQNVAGEKKMLLTPEKAEVVSSACPLINSLTNLSIDSDFDPFCDKLLEVVLKNQNFPKGFESEYVKCNSDLPVFKSSSSVKLGNEKFVLSEMVGKGAYAKVMKATNMRNEKIVALKVQKSSCDWEFYISRQIRERLVDKSVMPAFIYPDTAFSFRNGSVLVLDWLPYGTVLNVCNKVRERTGRTLHHLIATFWTRELLCIMRHLIKCSIIHGDVKPDNLMLRILPTLDLRMPSLTLIDFGRAIDMTQFPSATTFKKVVATSGFQCIEMKTKRPWTYQTDLYGVAGTAHCLLFGNYMKTCKQKSVDEWTIEASYPRYFCREEWKNFFTTLLNIESCDKIPDLQPLEDAFQKFLGEQKASLAVAFIQMNNILSSK